MRTYYKTTFLYMYFAIALTLVLQTDKVLTLQIFTAVAVNYINVIQSAVITALPAALLLIWLSRRRLTALHLRQVFLVAVASVMFQVGFMFYKSAIPQFVPFYADPFWAELDRGLLFGNDAWQVAAMITPVPLAAWFPYIYLTLWSLLAYAFPVLVAATDPDDRRILRYCWLFFLAWMVTGNLLALIGSSVGPVFYDQLQGTQRFAEMRSAFDLIGFSDGQIGNLQRHLWENSQQVLSYISAFPSVHVAVAAVAALYLRERFPRLQVLGYLFLALILLISVYSGYHYLVDGIASIAIVLLLNVGVLYVFRRRAAQAAARRAKSGPTLR